VSFANEILQTIDRFSAELDKLGVEWAVGGSVASSMHAEPRSTNDVDFIAKLRPAHAAALARSLEADFYIDEATALDAIVNHRSFNLIDEQTFVKIDVFVPPPGPLGADQLRRRVRVEMDEGFYCYVLGREDIVLQKLRWYRLGDCSSDRQWRDILGLLARREGLDLDYLHRVADSGGLEDLLERALSESA
jgi:hypothetical protein